MPGARGSGMSVIVSRAAAPDSGARALAPEAIRRELAGWAWLAIGALAVAGAFSILLALSRLPGIERIARWPFGFFGSGLVIHVVFSIVVWLLAMFALLLSHATLRADGPVRAAALGPMGQALTALAFPCLFAPAFLDSGVPELTNYVPLIRHPAYDIGLGLLACGILAPVARLFLNLAGRARPLPGPVLAVATGGFVYVVSLVCFACAAVILVRAGKLDTSREYLFWGGGHVLQFVYVSLMFGIWASLARDSFGENVVDPDIFRLCILLLAVFCLPAPMFYRSFEAFSIKQHSAFRVLQFVLALPTLLFAVSMLANALSIARPSQWPWRKPAFVALAMSLASCAVGGVMGMMISGSDTRTPAHYHAMMTAVSVACMGMLLTWGLRELDRRAVSEWATRPLICAYGAGQIAASVGLFLAGGYGAPRKTTAAATALVDGAVLGMYLHGLGALFAVIGGAAFVIVAVRALARARTVAAR